jgi:uncharacterized repeat protein (TIGR03803 family)
MRRLPELALALIWTVLAPSLLFAQKVQESTLYAFGGQPDGASPNPLVQGSDGNFYGTTVFGGNNATTGACGEGTGCGTIFRVSPSGAFTTLYIFTGGSDGAYPNQLIQGGDGNFYGTAIFGGVGGCVDSNSNVTGCGTVFRITPSGSFTVLYEFSGGSNGAYPISLIQGSSGFFYGVTVGTIFIMDMEGNLATLAASDGPILTGLVQGSDGNFYGATAPPQYLDNTGSVFSIFSMTPSGSVTTLYPSTGTGDAPRFGAKGGRAWASHSKPKPEIVITQPGHGVFMCPPYCFSTNAYASPLTEGSNGTFFGTTAPGRNGSGIVFNVTLSGSLSTLYTFALEGTYDPLTLGSDGNFYGEDLSTVFRITSGGAFTTFFDLTETDVLGPAGPLIQGSDGKFYGPGGGGNTNACNNNGCGTLYTLTASPKLSAPVKISLSSASIAFGSSVTVDWSVSNAFSTTLQQCYAFVQEGATGAGNWAGLQIGTLSGNLYSGSALLTPTEVGTYTLALTCGGVESGFATFTVTQAATTTKLVSSTNPSQLGQTVTFTATVTSQHGGVLTGYLFFNQGTTVLGSVTLVNGQGAVSTSFATGGKIPITAVYSGDINNIGSTSKALQEVVDEAPTAIQLVSSFNPSYVNQSVTFTATVTSSYGTPGGTVTFKEGTSVLGSGSLNSNGIATLTYAFPIAGAASITASYAASADFNTSSVSLSQKVLAAASFTSLYSFAGQPDGNNPLAGVILDSAGNLYGTTQTGGASNLGTVFKLSKAGKESVLYSFVSTFAGAFPEAGLIRDSSGNLYGIAGEGVDIGGTVFELNSHDIETSLYSFTGGADGSDPSGSLLRDSAGNLYGTAAYGGNLECNGGCGTVFKIDSSGNETVLYSFNGGSDGAYPMGGLVADSAGNLYGTTNLGGGSTNCVQNNGTIGCGTVFRLTPGGVETVLYSFTGANGDGALPTAGVILDATGNLYGTTLSGGVNYNGTVFKVSSTGVETVLYAFLDNPDGSEPLGGLVRDSSGNLYGTTFYGGKNYYGTVYELSAAGQEFVLYTFTGLSDGGEPRGGVVRDAGGSLYGTTATGGTTAVGGAMGDGTVFKITP